MLYQERVLSYFLNPAHAGEMEDPDGVGPVGDITCGDFFVMSVRLQDGRITQIRYQVFGCPAAIATCEAVAELAEGKTTEEALAITDETVVGFLGGLPEQKLHCSNSAAEALHRALQHARLRPRGAERLGGDRIGLSAPEAQRAGPERGD